MPGARSDSEASPFASKQLHPRGVELCGVGFWVVPVAEHPGQFLALQADHHRRVTGYASKAASTLKIGMYSTMA